MAMPITTDKLNNPSHSTLHNVHINAKAYNAVGDGVTDDTTALQNAINGDATCVDLILPDGTYILTDKLTLPEDVPIRIRGISYPAGSGVLGSGGVVLKQTGGATKDIFDIVHTATQKAPIIIENLTLDGNGTARYGINALYHYNVTLRNLRIYNFASYGIYLDRGCFNWEIGRIEFDTCDYGIYTDDTQSTPKACINGSFLHDLYFQNITKQAIYISDSDAWFARDILTEVINNNVDYTGSFKVDNCKYFNIAAFYGEAIYGNGIHIYSSAEAGVSRIFAGVTANGIYSALRITDSDRINVTSVDSTAAKDVVNLENADYCTISQVTGKDTTDIGRLVYVDANSNNNVISGGIGKGFANEGIYNLGSDNKFISNHIEGMQEHGIRNAGGNRNTFIGNTCKNNGQAGSGRAGIYIDVGTDHTIVGNHCYDDQGTKTQDYGIFLLSANASIIEGNDLEDNNDKNLRFSSNINTDGQIGRNKGQDEIVTAASPTLQPWGYSKLHASGTTIGATLPDGYPVGQIKTMVMDNSTNASTVTITHHETSDGLVGTFDATDETWATIWTGTEWADLKKTCT